MNRLGEDKYNEILSVTEEIKKIRYGSATWTKFSGVNASTGEKLQQLQSSQEDLENEASGYDMEKLDSYDNQVLNDGNPVNQGTASQDIPASITLHKPIYELYFQVRLMNVMATIDSKSSSAGPNLSNPYPCQCVVEDVDWDALLLDAKNKLEAFRKFEKENIGEEERLGFSCCWRGC